MAGKLLPILEYPEPSLMEPSDLVDLEDLEQLQELIDDMIYTMFYHEGVGLAAPQVDHNLRIFILDQRPINGNPRSEPWVFINPVIEPVDDNQLVRPEGCLSFPGLLAEVPRAEWVTITAFDRKGKEFTMDASHNHLLSVALQHEYDHLEGTLLSDRARGRDRRKIQSWAAKKG
jgi:peptide deformylase